MDKIEFTTAEREALHYWRFHHPHPRVQRKMEALYLKSQGLAPEDICRLCAISKPTFYRYLHDVPRRRHRKTQRGALSSAPESVGGLPHEY